MRTVTSRLKARLIAGSLIVAVGCVSHVTTISVVSEEDCPRIAGETALPSLAEALIAGDEAAATAFSCEFLRGNVTVNPALLDDSRELPISMILRVPTADHYYQFRPARVSDAALCLLGVKHRVTTPDILRSDSVLASVCAEVCDVCSSRVPILDERVRTAVREYWRQRVE